MMIYGLEIHDGLIAGELSSLDIRRGNVNG